MERLIHRLIYSLGLVQLTEYADPRMMGMSFRRDGRRTPVLHLPRIQTWSTVFDFRLGWIIKVALINLVGSHYTALRIRTFEGLDRSCLETGVLRSLLAPVKPIFSCSLRCPDWVGLEAMPGHEKAGRRAVLQLRLWRR